VRRADATSAQIGGPDGITRALQVTTNSGQPLKSRQFCNLLTKNDCRAPLADEPKEVRPQVPIIAESPARTRRAEWLAWA
jgi:hypothetical protein